MTQPKPNRDQADHPARQAERQSEVVISGVDTGPRNEERHNLTPTEDHARFQPTMHPKGEPSDEDG